MGQPQELMFQNQLQFNLHVPLTTRNLETHFRRPQPITVERVGGSNPHGFPMGVAHPPSKSSQHDLNASASSSVQFSAVSQDKLAAAVQLAKRDLKTRKSYHSNRHLDDSRARSPSPQSARHDRSIHGQRYWEMQAKKTRGRSTAVGSRGGRKVPSWKPAGGKLRVKEHDRNQAPFNTGTQTPPASPPRQAFLSNRPTDRSYSPPTRDTPSLTKVTRVPQNDIERLQMEMEMYLQQIESVERRALSEHNTDFLKKAKRSRSRDDHLDEEEGEERQRVRAEEQATRAARNIYNLRQQVKQIEREVHAAANDPKSAKKSQAASKLAAAHRAAVRVLQAFVNQLPYQDLRNGLPSHYRELSLLLRQLTKLSTQISQIEGRGKQVSASSSATSVQDDLIAMLDRVENLNADWCREIQNRDPGPKPFKEKKPPFVTDTKPSKEPFKVERVDKEQMMNRMKEDRKAWLQAGIKALVSRLKPDSQPRSPKSHLKKHKKKAPSLAVPTRKHPPARKGLLLPAHLRARRQQTHQSPEPHWEPDTHFADPTITANLKASTLLYNPITEPRSSSAPSSPGARRKEVNFDLGHEERSRYHASYPGTQRSRNRSLSPQPRRSRSLSPHPRSPPRSRSASPRSRSPGEGRRRFFVQGADQELVNEFFPRRKCMQRQVEQKQARSGLRGVDVSESFLDEVERRVAERLRPLLQNRRPSEEGVSEEEDRERLAEMIMDEVIEEAAEDFTSMERNRAARERAGGMMNDPVLENIYQRLEEMEREAQAIRQRWASVSYHDSAPSRRYRPDVRGFSRSEQPRDPPAFEVTKLMPEKEAGPVKAFSESLPEEPLIFTKDSKAFRPRLKFEERREDHEQDRPLQAPPVPKPRASRKALPPKTLLSVKQTVVERITDSMERFDYYQKGLKHHLGKREGWKIIESVADQILDECFEQVAAELEDINSAMADHIYTSEFMSETGLPLAPPELAEDFVRGGPAAQNLRDSAAAQRSVESSLAKPSQAEMRPFLAPAVGEAIGEVVGKVIGDGGGDAASPPWDTSLQHVYDATELIEATGGEVTEDVQPERVASVTNRDEDTKAEEVDYDEDFDEDEDDDDEYTDVSDDEDSEA